MYVKYLTNNPDPTRRRQTDPKSFSPVLINQGFRVWKVFPKKTTDQKIRDPLFIFTSQDSLDPTDHLWPQSGNWYLRAYVNNSN